MALLLTSPPSLLSKNPNPTLRLLPLRSPKSHSLSFSLLPKTTTTANPIFPFSHPLSVKLTAAAATDDNFNGESSPDDGAPSGVVDEWGEKAEPEIEPPTKLSDADPPKDEDEWGGASGGATGEAAGVVVDGPPTKPSDGDRPMDEAERGGVGVNGSAGAAAEDAMAELKRRLVDAVSGTDLGFRTSAEVRAEVSELVSQLEAANPTPAPTETAEVLNGNWILLYTAFSELLPLLAAGSTPFLKVKRICQSINTSSLTIENSTTLSSPFANFSFSASAAFEVRTPIRIQVEFKEGTLQPPEIKSSIELPENVDIFGQKINLSPVQQSLNPLQEAAASIAGVISGQPPLKVPIPGERTKSWLIITYLDKDLRISRGDGGLFVLAKEGSPLLDQ